MTAEILLRYLHFIFIFIVVSSVVAEHLLLKPQMTRTEIKRLSTIDGIYGLSSIVVVGVGLTLWLSDIGKPATFYTQNHIFLTKVGLFVIVGLLSIYPTVFFLKKPKRRRFKRRGDYTKGYQNINPSGVAAIISNATFGGFDGEGHWLFGLMVYVYLFCSNIPSKKANRLVYSIKFFSNNLK